MAAISNVPYSRPRPLFRATAIDGRIACISCDYDSDIQPMTCDLWTMTSDRIRSELPRRRQIGR